MICRSWSCVLFLLVLSAGVAPPAFAADDTAGAVLADCGSSDLPVSAIDSCLERVRVLDETDPSPQLQSLEAQLEQRETAPHAVRPQPRLMLPSANPSPPGTARYEAPMVIDNPHHLSPEAPDADRSGGNATQDPESATPNDQNNDDAQRPARMEGDRPPAGINDDQPPVADPPDTESPRDQSWDQPDNPQ